jgi:hypothetical protein
MGVTISLAPDAFRPVCSEVLSPHGVRRERVEILAMLSQRAEAAALLEDRMYLMLVNWFADWRLLGKRLRGEPAFEAFVRTRG